MNKLVILRLCQLAGLVVLATVMVYAMIYKWHIATWPGLGSFAMIVAFIAIAKFFMRQRQSHF